jgi:hypothetical protein
MSPPDQADDQIVCRVYTHARRHPIVIGNIQGLRIPPVTPAQLGVLVGSFVVLALTRELWGHLGSVGNASVMFAVPVALAWAIRAARIEGRAPWRAGLGWLVLLTAPRGGVHLGRPASSQARPQRCRGRAWCAELGDGS